MGHGHRADEKQAEYILKVKIAGLDVAHKTNTNNNNDEKNKGRADYGNAKIPALGEVKDEDGKFRLSWATTETCKKKEEERKWGRREGRGIGGRAGERSK